MNKFLRYSFVALLAMVFGNVMADEGDVNIAELVLHSCARQMIMWQHKMVVTIT